MNTQLFELKNSFKQLNQNLIQRIDNVVENLNDNHMQSLQFWLEDLSVLTEVSMILKNNNIVDLDLDVFNENMDNLLNKIEMNETLFISDLLQFEIKPLLQYWDGCITND